MLIVMDRWPPAKDIRRVVEAVEGHGLQAHPIPGSQRTAIGITGNRGRVDPAAFEKLPGVLEVIPVSAPYKLVSREAKRENTVISVGGSQVGGGTHPVIVGGPCAVESEEQTLEIARRVKAAGAHFLPRRRLQAAHLALLVPGARREGAARSCPWCDARRGCRSSPRCWTPRRWTSSPSTPTASRSARATCRTSRFCKQRGPREEAGPAQARHVGHHRRAA